MPAQPTISELAKKWPAEAFALPLWSIIDWADHFESAYTKKLSRLPSVLIPTKHDGKGFRRLMRHEKKAAVFACWVLMVQLAAKSPVRGYLADLEGPYTPLDMSDMTGMDADDFTTAIAVLKSNDIRWMLEQSPTSLELHSNNNRTPDPIPNHLQQIERQSNDIPTQSNDVRAHREVCNGKERKGNKELPLSSPEGDNEPVSSETETAEKKERGPLAATVAADAAFRILAMFPGATQLSAVCQGQLHEHVANGTLPADEKKWRALAAMRAERAAIEGIPGDFDLRAAWLVSKERLCRDLAEALDTAAAKRPQPSDHSPEPKNVTTAIVEPPDWHARLLALYPNAHVTSVYADLPGDVRKEIEAMTPSLAQ